MQSKKKTILAVAALVVIAAVLLLVWRAVTPKGEAGEKTITVQVLHKGGEERVFTLETGEAYLGAVLTAEGVVEDNQGPYASFLFQVAKQTIIVLPVLIGILLKAGLQIFLGALLSCLLILAIEGLFKIELVGQGGQLLGG